MNTEESSAASEFVLYQSEDGQTQVQVRLDGGTAWLTQSAMAELYQVTSQAINQHIAAIYEEGELDAEGTCNDYLQVREEGARRVQRRLRHYSLPVILAVGYRVRSLRGTQFRQWATSRLAEYLVKGFVLDDQRLKNPPGPDAPDYFEELVALAPSRTRWRLSEPIGPMTPSSSGAGRSSRPWSGTSRR